MSAKRFIPLTPKQRGYLAQLAKAAHTRLLDSGAIDDADFDHWRKHEAMDATSGFTISEAPKRCFDALETRFLTLSGQAKQAFERNLGPDNDMRQVAHNITVAARTAGVTAAYISGICQRMFGRTEWKTAAEGKAVLIALKQHARRKNEPQHTTESES